LVGKKHSGKVRSEGKKAVAEVKKLQRWRYKKKHPCGSKLYLVKIDWSRVKGAVKRLAMEVKKGTYLPPAASRVVVVVYYFS